MLRTSDLSHEQLKKSKDLLILIFRMKSRCCIENRRFQKNYIEIG
jgi:hypothetical protein